MLGQNGPVTIPRKKSSTKRTLTLDRNGGKSPSTVPITEQSRIS